MRNSLLSAILCSSALLAPTAYSQRFVSLDGTPGLSAVSAPPSATRPVCTPSTAICPVPLPPFAPGIALPSVGGEAIDELGGMAYTSNGMLIAATAFPGCTTGPVVPTAAWPPGPCGAIGASPIVAMSDAAGVGTLWVLNASGLVSLIPFPPGPVIAQALAPLAAAPLATGVTWNPATGLLHFIGASTPFVFTTPTPAGFACAPLPVLGTLAIPACLPPPFLGVTIDTALAPGPIPALVVSNGSLLANISGGTCVCPLLPPAGMPTTDIEFANVPNVYGIGCGCDPTIDVAGGLPVVANAGFAVVANRAPVGSLAVLLIAGTPALIPIGACNLLIAPSFLSMPPIPTTPVGTGPCAATATFPLPIPASAVTSVGTSLYLQWLFFPSPTLGAFELSSALELTLGFG